MNEPKNESSNIPVQASQGPATKAQKVRSSRYEWEGKTNNENEKAVGDVVEFFRKRLVEEGKSQQEK